MSRYTRLSILFILTTIFSSCFSACPNGYIDGLDDLTCYKPSSKPADWFNAEKDCISLGGHISSIQNSFVNNYLRGIAENAFGTITQIWIGAIKWPEPINWIWSDYKNFSYANWALGITFFFIYLDYLWLAAKRGQIPKGYVAHFELCHFRLAMFGFGSVHYFSGSDFSYRILRR